MKNVYQYLLPITLAVTLLAILFNFNGFLMGHASIANSVVTCVYVICWTGFSFIKKSRKTHIFALIWSGLTIATALVSGIVVAAGLSLGFALAVLLPLVCVFLVPFQGVTIITGNNWTLFYSIIIFIGILWIVINLNGKKRR